MPSIHRVEPALRVFGAGAQFSVQRAVPTVARRERRRAVAVTRVHILLELTVFFRDVPVGIDDFEICRQNPALLPALPVTPVRPRYGACQGTGRGTQA